MKKQIVSETKQYAPSFPDELLLDDTPKVNSFNGVTSDGVARAIAGSGDVPAPGEGDDGKVLTVVDGSAAWAESQGGSSYTAGEGIVISNENAISVTETVRSGAAAGATAVQPAALNDYATTSSLTSGLSTKQDTISDLETIRSGAAAGATAVQPGTLATVATTGSYTDLSNKPTIPTVDQTYSAVSTNAQSGVAVAGALATVKQVPSSTSSDEDKVLTVDSNGDPVWADQSSASIDRDGTALEVRLRNANGANNSGLAVSTTETPTSITGVVSSGGPNSSYYATFTKAVALDPDADTVNITGFEASIPSGTTTPVYAVVVDGSTWQSGTLTGGIICDHDTDDYPYGIDLANPAPCKAFVITDPSDQHATSTFFSDVNTFMVFGVSEDNLFYFRGRFQGNFVDKWRTNGLYSALEQYAVAMTQPSGDVEFEIPSRPSVSRGLYVANPLQAYSIGDAGKVLAVNSGATGTEWVEQPSLSVNTAGVMAGTGTAQDPVVLNYGTGLSTAPSQATNLVNITGISTNGTMTTSFELTAQDCAAINASIASGLGEVSMVPSASFSIIMESAASVDNHVRFRLIDRNANVQYYGPVVATIPQGQTSVTVDSSNFSHLPLDQFHVGGVSGPALDGSTYALPASNDYVGALFSDEEYVDIYDSRALTINFAEAGAPQLVVSNPVPASAIADAGKVLAVNNSGAAAWATLALGSVQSIQQVSALPATPDANTLYLIPEA